MPSNKIPEFSMKVLVAMCEIADPSDPRFIGADEIAEKMNVSIEQVKGALAFLESNNYAIADVEMKTVKRGKKLIRVHADNLVTPTEQGLIAFHAVKVPTWTADDLLNSIWDSN